MITLDDAVLPLIRTRADLHRRLVANEHGRQPPGPPALAVESTAARLHGSAGRAGQGNEKVDPLAVLARLTKSELITTGAPAPAGVRPGRVAVMPGRGGARDQLTRHGSALSTLPEAVNDSGP